jgi:predicted dinucleotide-binding enzyme
VLLIAYPESRKARRHSMRIGIRLVVADTTSGAETLARKVRKARVVSAFSTAPSEVLFDVFRPSGCHP